MKSVPPKFKKASQAAAGFSLIELMMAVAIIGILANLSMMAFGGLSQTSEFQKNKRNAQEIAGLASMASAAGADFIVPGDERATIVNLRTGVTPTTGVFNGRIFIIPGLSDTDITGAMTFLTLNETDLLYNQSGNAGGSDQLNSGG
jgi:prepilin-type N-terminal cleavage/methylation domain-containing protein